MTQQELLDNAPGIAFALAYFIGVSVALFWAISDGIKLKNKKR